jgi:3-hydroxy-9,10-secoandrosta-1,3,5(10)-triene-9,17-dione monooxygenase reductase component
MGYFPTGVTIVTSWDGPTPVGSTVSAFCSVSLAPPLLLICLDNANPICGPLLGAGVFGVNFLNEESRELALHFAYNTDPDRFAAKPYHAAEGGAPQLDVAPVFIDCVVEQAHQAGDHLIVVGRGLRIDHASAHPPLLHHRGGFLKVGS